MMVLHDQHVHTKYSKDSKEELFRYLDKVSELGCTYFVTTDHLDFNVASTGDDWIADYKSELQEINSLKERYPNIRMLLGIEFGYNKKYMDEIKKIIESLSFDLINMSIHDYEDIDLYYFESFKKRGIKNTMNAYFDKMIEAVSNCDNFDVLSHIDYAFKTIYLNDNSLLISEYEEKIKIVMNELIKKDKSLEINTKVQESINNDDHLKYLLKLYKSLGGKNITLSSDAHSLDRYLSSFDKYKNIIKEEGFNFLAYYVKREKRYFNI